VLPASSGWWEDNYSSPRHYNKDQIFPEENERSFSSHGSFLGMRNFFPPRAILEISNFVSLTRISSLLYERNKVAFRPISPISGAGTGVRVS
jgi:hypothetical protein